MKTYELQKVETYQIRARNEEEAIEILNGLDNSSAHKVEIHFVFVSAPEGSK